MMSGKKELTWGVVSNAWKQLSALQASVGDLQRRIETSHRAIADSETHLQRAGDALRSLERSGTVSAVSKPGPVDHWS